MNIRKIKSQLSEESRRESRIRLRIALVAVFIGVGYFAVSVRAVQLHWLKDSALGWVASKQYNAIVEQSPRRGRILDRTGRELAVSLPVKSIYTDPRSIVDPVVTADKIALALSLDKKDVLTKLKSPKKFAWIKRKATRQEAEVVEGISGIYTVGESKRFYPNGDLSGQILGAVGFDSDALGGVELAYNKFLSTKKVSATYKRDARGRFYFAPISYEQQDDVSDLYLTIDKQIQFVADNALKRGVDAAHARGGSVIVMDVLSGAILAMSNMPSFDPNDYSKYDQGAWRNRAVTDTFEPGSTFKALIVASAIEKGVVTPETIFNCENGSIAIGKAVLHDHNPYGSIPVKDIIKVSSNIGALKVAREMGKERLYEVLRKFGIGKKTGVDFPGEVSGIVRPPETWQPVELGTIAFGQGIGVTPIQMTTAFAAIANGGRIFRPYVIDRVVNNQGITILKTYPEVLSTPIGSETAEKMVKMLGRVVEEGGTGTKAATPEYKVAGKTGTAQKVVEGLRHYASGKYYASFIGLAPSDSPRIAVFVGIDEPHGAYYGGVVAAPLFREIVEKSLKHMAVPSSLSKVVMADNNPVQENAVPIAEAMHRRFHKIEDKTFEVPNLEGATIRDVLSAVGQANVKLKLEGSGVAINQTPSAGSLIREGEVFKVSFRQRD